MRRPPLLLSTVVPAPYRRSREACPRENGEREPTLARSTVVGSPFDFPQDEPTEQVMGGVDSRVRGSDDGLGGGSDDFSLDGSGLRGG